MSGSDGPRPTRLPLQIGIQALFSLAITGGTLVPAILIFLGTLFLLIAKGWLIIMLIITPQSWVIAAGAVIAELVLLALGITHLKFALRTRPADALLDDAGMQIDGGPMHGTDITWDSCTSVSQADDESDTAFEYKRLVLNRRHGRSLTIASAEEETELTSLNALREIIETHLLHGNVAPLPPEEHPDLVRCPSCSAPCAPVDAEQSTCSFCSASVPIPKSVRDRLRAANEVLASSRIATKLLPKLLDQPGARITTILSLIAGIPIALAWIAAVYFGMSLWHHHGFTLGNVWSLSIASCVIVVGSYYLMRFWLVNRMALSVVTTQFGAFPPVKTGAPWTCRSCSAPLPAARDGLLTRCAWCNSDNVLGVDVRPRADGARKQRNTLEAAFERRKKDRRKYAGFAAIALALLPGSVWLFIHGTKPLTDDARLAYECDIGDASICLQYGEQLVRGGNASDAIRPLRTGCKLHLDDACVELAGALGKAAPDDDVQPRDVLQQACERRHGPACTALARLIIDRKLRGLSEPAVLFQQACDDGDPDGCVEIGLQLKDEHQAIPLYEKACAAHFRRGCAHLGKILLEGPDTARALKLLADACPDKDPDPLACSTLGEAYWSGVGGAKDHAKAAGYLKVACDAGSIGTACTRYGQWAEEDGTKDPEVRASWYQAGCLNGDPRGCIPWSNLHATRREGRDILDNACDRYHDGEVCSHAGELFEKNNPTYAQKLYTISCDASYAHGCNKLGQLADKNEDYDTSRPALVKACDLGLANGCDWLGLELLKGKGSPADPAQALVIFERACAMQDSDGFSCAQAARLVQKSGDAAHATELLGQACTKGYERACPATETP